MSAKVTRNFMADNTYAYNVSSYFLREAVDRETQVVAEKAYDKLAADLNLRFPHGVRFREMEERRKAVKEANEELAKSQPSPAVKVTSVHQRSPSVAETPIQKPTGGMRYQTLERINLVLIGINLTLLAFIFYSVVL